MKRFVEFLREKGFYVALGVGVIAFAGLIFLYDYKDSSEEISKEQAIDLNQNKTVDDAGNGDAKSDQASAAQNDKDNSAAATDKTTENQVADNSPSTTEDKDKYVDEPVEVEGAVEVMELTRILRQD